MTDLAPEDKALKVVTAALVEACGGASACSHVLSKAQSLISGYCLQSEPKRFMPLNDVRTLERLCGRAIVSEWMCRQIGAPADPGALALADVALFAREGAEAQLAVVRALEDGRICAADRAEIRRELDDVAEAVAAMRDKVGQP
ncbi:hypothetical protein [Jiella marina]|uniref:hypothetical protein n=1 Tax=Jiella sp. LLJ827 TaxID=2917712 RepID=UPI002101C12C|nr:hypothetical protein [Jiella sp. LLJ827]MCQ0986424.1 hypothetical protein [Jiella sp. LLJ827]